MSITSDLRSYADTAVTESRKAFDSTLTAAQAQLNDVTGSANDLVDKASDAVNDLRVTAEKAINVDAIKAAIEPYLAQARTYQVSVQHRAESILAELKKDPRFAKAIDTADAVSDVVFEAVQERVVKPVASLTGFGAKQGSMSATTSKPSPTKAAARKPAATKPANRPAKPAASTKPAAAKPASTSATVRPSAARKATTRKTTTKRSTKA